VAQGASLGSDRAEADAGEYRELLAEADVAPPSREQMEDFARFVATAHSWYKHLGLLPPGHPMTFFLDPGAGAQLIVASRGRVHQVERLERGFHYSWLRTADYRERFGHASYAGSAGTGTAVLLEPLDRGGQRRIVVDAEIAGEQDDCGTHLVPLLRASSR
jgi:hypothetical protein